MPLDIDPASVRGVWFRHVPMGGAPLRRPELPSDGRWQRGEMVEGLYLADSDETAWAEWYRALAELATRPLQLVPRDLWRFHVDVEHVADLSSSDCLDRVDLPATEPDRRQWPSFQAVGEMLFAEGWAGVLSSAAARPGSLALCLFRTGGPLSGVRPMPPAVRHDEPPVPPRGLRTRARQETMWM